MNDSSIRKNSKYLFFLSIFRFIPNSILYDGMLYFSINIDITSKQVSIFSYSHPPKQDNMIHFPLGIFVLFSQNRPLLSKYYFKYGILVIRFRMIRTHVLLSTFLSPFRSLLPHEIPANQYLLLWRHFYFFNNKSAQASHVHRVLAYPIRKNLNFLKFLPSNAVIVLFIYHEPAFQSFR